MIDSFRLFYSSLFIPNAAKNNPLYGDLFTMQGVFRKTLFAFLVTADDQEESFFSFVGLNWFRFFAPLLATVLLSTSDCAGSTRQQKGKRIC